jgi:hypothetical protein
LLNLHIFINLITFHDLNHLPMNSLKSGLFVICLNLLWTISLSAQFNIEDFRLSGTATKINDQCIRLVPDFQYVSGSAWYEKPIDLSVPFQMEVCLIFGEKDLDGADGIVFVFHPRVAITGWRGEGMGFSGLRPSPGHRIRYLSQFSPGGPGRGPHRRDGQRPNASLCQPGTTG